MQTVLLIVVVLAIVTVVLVRSAFAREGRARTVLGALAALGLAVTLLLGSGLFFFQPTLCGSLGGRWHEQGTNCTDEWGGKD